MDKKKAICEYLRKNHIGKENAIHSKELEKLFLLDGRNIRRKISALRQDGFPICSDETGYYYADNQKEINNGRRIGCSAHQHRQRRRGRDLPQCGSLAG